MDINDIKKTMDFQTKDRVDVLIIAGGGQTQLAKTLGFSNRQRVEYWRKIGRVPELTMLKSGKKLSQIVRRYERLVAKQAGE